MPSWMESKYTAEKTWDEFKSKFFIAHQELKDADGKTVVDAGFISTHLVAQVVEGITNILQPTGDGNEGTLL